MEVEKMNKTHSINHAISKLLFFVVFIVTLIYSSFILMYSWLVEDNIFNRQVMEEAKYIKQVYHATGNVISPRISYMSLHPNWEGLPLDFKYQHQAKPDRVEFDTENNGTMHIQILELDNEIYALAANVSAFEVSRDYLPNVVIWLIAFSFSCCLIVALIAYKAAKKITLPLNLLATQISVIGDPEKIKIKGDYPDNEIGTLASCLEQTISRLQQALAREAHFTKDVSHEIRTPIAIAANILSKPIESISIKDWQKLNETNFRLNQITETLLALARNESTETLETNLTELLEQCLLSNADISYTEKGQGIEFEIIEQSDIYQIVNPNLVSILFHNVLSNIVHYISGNRVTISPTSKSIEFKNHYQQANHKTMSEDLPESLLESGTKGENSQGIGHGLNLIKRIAEIYGWQIEVSAKGDVFILTIVF